MARLKRDGKANIVGISAYFHDAACCLLQDGHLVAAAEEERFTRIKHDPALPQEAFSFCLQQAGLDLPDIDALAYYEVPSKKLARQLWMSLPGFPRQARSRRLDPTRPEREIRTLLGYEGPIHFVEHHQAHAASSYYFSGFDEAAVLTVDGVGEWATTSYGAGRGHDLQMLEEVLFPDSLGLLYSALTGYLGFEVNEGEYKVMGLAPYGQPRYVDQVRRLIHEGPDGQYTLAMEYFGFLNSNQMYSPALPELFGQPPRERETEILPFHQDVARSLQVVLEEVLLAKIRYLHQKVPSENLCMAGGVALNCVANGRILREGPFRRLFVQPAASDAGGALGAAALAHIRLTGEAPAQKRLEHAYWGPGFTAEQVHRVLRSTPLQPLDFRRDEPGLLRAVVDRLVDGKVVGWFHGRMEFGPRALGARSILADPRRPEMRDRINALVKMREAFRPFAPAVLAAEVPAHFEIDHPSPFMLETCQVKSPIALPAITHVDGSARLQTVDPATSPRYAALLEEFHRRTGCPILLNTSFNLRGEPIVLAPAHALRTFIGSGLDSLVLEDFLIDRSMLPPQWSQLLAGMQQMAATPISHDVYTFF